jgi:LysR family nitrogen assimilation transcriptional regulator
MTGQIWGWLEAGKVELGILNYLGPRRGLVFREIASEELFLIGPPRRFGTLERLPEITLDELPRLQMILPGLPHGLRQLIDQETARHGIALDVWRDLDALAHIGRLIEAADAYSILPLPVIADDLTAGRVSVARIAGGSLRRRLVLARNSSAVVTRATVRAEQLTVEVLQQLITSGEWQATATRD